MKKLRLNPEELSVESFHIQSPDAAVGTVQGRMDAMAAAATWWISWCDTCKDTCEATCPATCMKTCESSCVNTKETGYCCTASCPHQTDCDVQACRDWITETGTTAGA